MKAFIIATILGIFTVQAAHAAVLTVQSPDSENQIVVSLDTQGQSINAFDAHFSFNPAEFTISGVSDGGSIVDFWITPPSFSNGAGTIDLAGIIPGGIDTASGTIATISIIPQENGLSEGLQIASATVLLNDGKGTPAALSFESGPFVITVPSSSTFTPPAFVLDVVPPEPFTPEIARDPAIFNDHYFLSFATTDANSGINHYEVLEVSTAPGGSKSSEWQVAQSPYLLKDQTLASNIYVRAVDNAGNFRVVELPAEHPAAGVAAIPISAFYDIAGCAILLLCAGILLRRRTAKKI